MRHSKQESEETRMMGLPVGWKSFKIDLAILIQYRRVTDTHVAVASGNCYGNMAAWVGVCLLQPTFYVLLVAITCTVFSNMLYR